MTALLHGVKPRTQKDEAREPQAIARWPRAWQRGSAHSARKLRRASRNNSNNDQHHCDASDETPTARSRAAPSRSNSIAARWTVITPKTRKMGMPISASQVDEYQPKPPKRPAISGVTSLRLKSADSLSNWLSSVGGFQSSVKAGKCQTIQPAQRMNAKGTSHSIRLPDFAPAS